MKKLIPTLALCAAISAQAADYSHMHDIECLIGETRITFEVNREHSKGLQFAYDNKNQFYDHYMAGGRTLLVMSDGSSQAAAGSILAISNTGHAFWTAMTVSSDGIKRYAEAGTCAISMGR